MFSEWPLLYGVTAGTTGIGNQAALYRRVAGTQLGTASGLFRTFTYAGSLASSTLAGLVFHARVDDAGVHRLAAVLIGVSAVVAALTVGADTRPHLTGPGL